jgi:fibronectin-binding autotransporter adhesin
LNFVGKFDAKLPVDGPIAHPAMHAHVDGASAHAPSDAIIVPDAQLLFGGEFKRSGVDLVLSDDHHELVLHDYFKGEKRVALASPDGAHLTGDLVNALAGHVEYAQADGAAAAAAVVGHVTKLTGTATAIRNGVSIILNQGDNIDKGDVLQSGADSTLGVTFIDGTVFGLSSNARMVVNEMIYDPNGSNNSSLLSLVAGTISFVAGETAKHGDMKVDTPVATMGIRGTAVLVEIDFSVPGANGAPSANFQVLVEPDGTTGSYILFDKNTLAPLATVNTAGTLTKISQGIVSFEAGSPLTSDQQKLITDLFTTKFGDSNTKSLFDHFTDSIVPQSLQPIYLPGGVTVTPIVLLATNALGASSSAPSGPTSGVAHTHIAPQVTVFNQSFGEIPGDTGSPIPHTLSAPITFTDPNSGDRPTVTVDFASFTYQDGHGHDIGASLTPQEKAAIAAVEGISLQTPAGNDNNGSAVWTYSFPDGAFDFLGAGETLTLTYTASVNNNYASDQLTGTATFTITITGTNDVPVITSSVPQTIAFTGGTSVPGGDLTAHVPTSGTISFDDPDLTDTHTVSVKLLLNGLDLPPTPLEIFEHALTASVATDSTGTGFGTIKWQLADLPVYLADFIPKGETITLTYVVTVTDSQGATSTQDITVTITGSDTPAVVWIATTTTGSPPGGLWSDALKWETGTVPTATDDVIIITNQLIGLTPSYPVTIDANTAAVAKSVTMNDFGTSPPELINLGSLAVSGAFDMSADSILHNSGTISVGGLMEVLDTSVLQNSGTLKLGDGGDFSGHSTITNAGTIEISGGVLTVEADIANAGGIIDVDGAGSLTLNGGAIDGGTIHDNGTIHVTGASKIDGHAALDGGTVTIDAVLTLDNVTVSGTTINDHSGIELYDTVKLSGGASIQGTSSAERGAITNNGTLEVAGLVTLLNDTLTNTSGSIIQIDSGDTLALSGTSITGGTINDSGGIDVTGSSTISNAGLNHGGVTIEANQTLTLDSDTVTGTNFSASGATILIDGSATLDEVTITGGTITNSGATLTIDAGQMLTLQGGASLVGGTLDNSGTLEIESSSGATLDGVTITGSGGIQVDVAASSVTPTLVLDHGTSITSGSLTVGPFGTLAVETAGGATLNGVNVTNKNSIEVFAGSALTLDQLTTIDNSTGTIAIDGTGILTLDDATIDGGTATNNGTLKLDGTAVLKNGTLYNYSQINVSSTGNELDNENITNASAIAILAVGVLTLDHLTKVDNTGGLITVYGTGTLALNDATITGGTINDYSEASSPSGSIVAGDIEVTGSSTLSSVHLNNGQVTIESGVVLTLDNDTVAGTHFSDTGATIQVDGNTTLTLSDATITGGAIDDFSPPSSPSGSIVAGDIDVTASSTISGAHLNNGQVTIESGVVLTLDNDTVTGTHFSDTGATIQIDGGTTLTLDGATINGGAINDFSTHASNSIVAGDIDIIGNSTISDASLNHGNVTIESGEKLTLDGDTVNGTAFTNVATGSVIHVDGGDTLTLNDATTITGGSVTIGVGAIVKTSGDVTLTNTSVTNDGKIEVTDGILKITGSVGSTPGDHGSIQIDSGAVLDLNGADTQDVAFVGAGGKLQIDASSFGGGSISGLTAGDEIDLSTIGYGPNTTGTYVSNAAHTGGVLTISNGANSISMTLVGDYSNAHFAGSSDGGNGTLITLNANDDAPAFAAADKSESATVTELPNTTESSASDPSPAASGTLHFTDIDLTDRPTATVTQSVSWTEGAGLTSGEIQTLEHAFTLTQSGNTNNGSLGWTYQISDGALDFLGAGVTATVTSTIKLDDHQHGTDAATVTVTIDGANDLPVIVGESNPATETIILHTPPTVLSAGTNTNSLGLHTESFDDLTAGSASNNGLHHGNFTSTALDATFTASGDAGIVHGSSSVSAAPFIGPWPGHADATNYLSIGAHGSETITFASEQNEFGLYWGSADSFNTISFYDGNNLVASYSGTDVAPLLANGNQGSFASNGYVEFSDLAPFDKVVLASGSSNAFEVDNISSGFISNSHVHLAAPISGTLTVSDADIGDTLTASVTGNGIAEYNGSTILPPDANVSALIDSSAISFDTVQTTGGQDVLDWTYNPANADLDFLEPGDKLTLTFNALVSDGHANTEVQPLTVTLVGNGAATVNGTGQSETFANVGGGVTIFGHGGQDNFVFNKNFGSATIGDFNVNTDTIDIDHSLFANVTALLQHAHSANSGHDTIITDAAHDKLTLTGVTLAQLQAHQSDFHFI